MTDSRRYRLALLAGMTLVAALVCVLSLAHPAVVIGSADVFLPVAAAAGRSLSAVVPGAVAVPAQQPAVCRPDAALGQRGPCRLADARFGLSLRTVPALLAPPLRI